MFENLDDPKRQALLMMAAGLLSPQDGRMGKGSQFAAALSQGLQGGLLGYNNASREQRRAKGLEQETEVRRMQMKAMKAQQAKQQQIDALGSQFFQQPMTQDDPASMQFGNTTPGKQDMGGYAQALMGIDPMKGIQLQQMMQKDESPLVLSEGATAVNRKTGLPFASNPKVEKPKFVRGDTRTIKAGNFEETQEYDGSSWKRIGQAPLWKPDAPDKGSGAPAGFRFTPDGNLQAIPGGPADTKMGEKAEAMQKREAGALARADMVLGNVREAIGESGVTTAGPIGAIGRNIPGTGAYNLNKKLDAIRSNIGFAELQAMREASPTGGALGQVAVQELNMLQSVLGSLDTAQSPAQLEKNLYTIEKHYSKWKRAVQQAGQYGGSGGVMRFDSQGNPLP